MLAFSSDPKCLMTSKPWPPSSSGAKRTRQGKLRRHFGGRDAAFHRRHVRERGRRADDAGALPWRRSGAAGLPRRPHTGERQSSQRSLGLPSPDRSACWRSPGRNARHSCPMFRLQGIRLQRRREIVEGVWLPANTPNDVVQALSAAMHEASQSKAMLDSLAKFATEPAFQTPAQFTETIKSEIARWGPVVKNLGFVALDLTDVRTRGHSKATNRQITHFKARITMEALSWSVLTFLGVVVLFIVLGSFFTVRPPRSRSSPASANSCASPIPA